MSAKSSEQIFSARKRKFIGFKQKRKRDLMRIIINQGENIDKFIDDFRIFLHSNFGDILESKCNIYLGGFSDEVLEYSNADGFVDCFNNKAKIKIIRQKLKDKLLKDIEVLKQESKKLDEYVEKYKKAINNNRSEATIRKHKDNYDNLVEKIENFFILNKIYDVFEDSSKCKFFLRCAIYQNHRNNKLESVVYEAFISATIDNKEYFYTGKLLRGNIDIEKDSYKVYMNIKTFKLEI